MSERRHVAFLFIGGAHHVFHTMPVACALSMRAGVEVTAFAADAETKGTIEGVLTDHPGAKVHVERLKRYALIDKLGRPSLTKLPTLWRNRRRLAAFDALVVAECTSIALRRMGVRRSRFICLPHGAGDRAISFEPRFRQFDKVLVAGAKTRRRMVESGVSAERVVEVGYPKAEYLARRSRQPLAFFDNDWPCILYNPHFRPQLSSLDQAFEIVRAIGAVPACNLIVAPHIRVFEGASEADRQRWRALEVPGKVMVDTGSTAMIDMSHVAAADLYVGDVSSQVYEYLLLGIRPCLFLNAHDVAWQSDPDYAFWQLGDVVTPDAVVAGIQAALDHHGRYRAAQEAAVAATFGTLAGSAERAADAVLAALTESR
jgi:hypothetical protein